jgi:4-hydroxyphenylpyruvate dioxygenase
VRHCIATVSLGGGLQEKLYAIAAAGFQSVEFLEADLTFYDGPIAEVRDLIENLNLSIALFQPHFDFEAVSDAEFAKSLDRAERKFDVMAELGAELMLVSANSAPNADPDEARASEQLRALAERAKLRGFRIGYEALAWGTHIRSWRDALRVIERANHPHLGLILDSFHSLAQGEDPAGIEAIPGDKIFHVQLSDAPGIELDIRTLGRHFRCLPGTGVLDIAGFVSAALKAGYRGPLSAEIFSDDLRAAPVRQTAVEAHRALTFIEEQAAASWSKADAEAAGLAVPAAPPGLGPVSFIEFAVDQVAAEALDGWLQALAFSKAGHHRSKDVDLYTQGGILIALNRRYDSFAYAYRRLHGTSVCAIGMTVKDRAAMLERAKAYRFRIHQEQTEDGEYKMPAVRAPDGSLFHIVDSSFDALKEFTIEPHSAEGAGLLTVDHVGRAATAAEFDSWVSFFKILFGLAPDASWDLADPHGVIHSRALADRDRQVRFPLAYSDSNRTALAKSVSSFSGSGVNQIAFATADIFASVEGLRARGARLLPVPGNYYDELAAVSDLDPEQIERMRRLDILYDADKSGGRFFHAYTETFQDRFFFEIVQRMGGYDQYGAVNAPVRMAAQARRRRSV